MALALVLVLGATAPRPVVAGEEDGTTASVARYDGGNYRWLASRGPLDFSFRFDTPGRLGATGSDRRLPGGAPFVETLPTLSLDLRDVDGPVTRRLRQAQSDEAVGSRQRVGIQWKPAESQLLFLRQGLGVRLGGDDRLTMRLRKGTLGIYMKREF